MAVICIDAGNSFVKVALMEQAAVLSQTVIPVDDTEQLQEYIDSLPAADGAIVSTVSKPAEEMRNRLLSKVPLCMELTHHTSLPINNTYRTPETLGKDRIAAVVGAFALYPGKNVLIIDAGTALTIDFLDSQKKYHGGNISPGLTMRFQALHDYTEKLPLLTPAVHNGLLGDSTESAIIAGIQNGIIFEIEQYIKYFQKKYPQMICVATGGDTFFLKEQLKNTIFAEPSLVLVGLENIFNFNLTQNNWMPK
ncbi:MAG: type III pantothenate kinase [Bacteroidales bacterium]|nr:type III pantothenate kinase [Bacteroidales bacterium]